MATGSTKSNTPLSLESRSENAPATKGVTSDSLVMGVAFAIVLTIIGRGIGFVRGLLFCRFMSDQQLGQWSMVWSFLMLIAPLAVLGLPGCFGRFVEHYRQKGQLRTFVFRITAVSSFVTLLVTASIFLFPQMYSWLVFRETTHTSIVMWIGLSLIFIVTMNFLTSLMEALRQVRLVTVMRFILGVAFITVSCSLMLVWQDMAAAATLGYGASCLVASIPAFWFLWKFKSEFADNGEPLSQNKLWSRIAPFALWMWWSNMCYNLFEAADRYMLIHWSPVEATAAQSMVGQYHSGRVLPLLLVSVGAVLAHLLMPYLTESWEKGDRKKVRVQMNWTLKLVSVVFTTAGVAILLFAPVLFEQFLQGRYNDGRAVLPLTLVYCIWMSLFVLGQDYLWVLEKGKVAFAVVGIGLLLNIGLNCAMIPTMGIQGAVLATSIANAFIVIAVFVTNHLYGCKTDIGIWLTLLLPLCLILPPVAATVILALTAIAAIKTQFVFNSDEKAQLAEAATKVRAKIGV